MRKNINPISLKGQDKINRSLELMNRMTTLNESTSTSELELIKRAPNGVVYGIVRENHKYFIKESNKKSGEITANDFFYIGGLQNKLNESYKSYSDALRHLNLRFDAINESMGIDNNVNIFESDGVAFAGGTGFGFVLEEEIEDEEEDEIDEQEYKLKVDAPASAEPAPPVEDEVDVEPMDDMGGDDLSMDTEPMDDMGDGAEDEDDPTKKIQKLTGKIGQMMREMDEPDVELEKYVINSIISAMHLDLLSEEDIEDIINKIEGEEEEDAENADVDLDLDTEVDAGTEEVGATEELPTPEAEVTEESRKFKKSQLIESLTKGILNDTLTESDSFSDYSPSGQRAPKSYRKRRQSLRDKSRGRLKGNQYKLDKAAPFGKLTSADFKKLRGESMDMMDEHHGMSYTNYGKFDRNEYMMMDEDFDSFLSNEWEDSSDYVDCPRCEGMGCPHCDDRGYHLSNEFEDDFDIADDFMTIDGQTGEYGPFDRDGDEIPSSIDMDDDGDGFLDEDNGYGVDVFDSVSGSFSDEDFMMYDPQTGGMGPFDFDGDGIPTRLDLDADGDGDIDGTEDDFDIEFFAEPSTKPRPTTTPSRPGVDPGEKKRRNPWDKPKTKPKHPKAGLGEGEKNNVKKSYRKKGWYK